MNNYSLSFERTIIYPYGIEFAPILTGLINQGQIGLMIKLISPLGWSLDGLDAGEAFGRPKLNITIKRDFTNELIGCSTFIVAPFSSLKNKKVDTEIDKNINQYIMVAENMGINVIDLRKVVGMKAKTIRKIYMENEMDHLEIDTPVAFVSGTAENVNKLDVQIKLRECLEAAGYRVCNIGSREYSDILNMYPFPHFMFEPIGEIQKIEYFKYYLYDICQKEKPDIIIIGIPGASVKFNDNIPSNYGIINYLVSMSVRPDFSLVCVPFGIWNIDALYEHRFGYKVGCCMVSNTKINYDPIAHEHDLQYEFINHKQVEETINSNVGVSPTIHFNTFGKNDINKVANLLINSLGKEAYFSI